MVVSVTLGFMRYTFLRHDTYIYIYIYICVYVCMYSYVYKGFIIDVEHYLIIPQNLVLH